MSADAKLTNDGPWKCFHCWEVFTDAASAGQHFGPWPENVNFPRCIAGLKRKVEQLMREATLRRCEWCRRPKARNADDCAAGCRERQRGRGRVRQAGRILA